ncbi:hypothetical protein PLESTM_000354000 [Pleodorina starrii]|nr:hypothetical protein PLESTM_000354000 [Pleodorina starrii]
MTTCDHICPPAVLFATQFELRNLYPNRKDGSRINVFVKYRHYKSDYVEYRDVERVIRPLVYAPGGGKGLGEVLRGMAEAVWGKFPIRGLHLRIEYQGTAHASSLTVGDMEP